MLKPDAVSNGYIGGILNQIIGDGFKIIAMKYTRLTPETAAEAIRFDYIGGGEGVMTRNEMLLHVINHSTYHRGFVADFFYQIPVQPPATDFTVYLRDARPRLD